MRGAEKQCRRPRGRTRGDIYVDYHCRAEDLGGYFRVRADTRDLNYDRFTVGNVRTQADEDYTSHNTRRLNVAQTVEKIKTTEFIQEELAKNGQ